MERDAVFRRSISRGNTLILSRYYERVDVDSRVVLDGGLRHRFPDLAMENFGLAFVHASAQWDELVVNRAKKSYVLVYLDEEYHDAVALLKLGLPPGIGAIFAPEVLDKTRLVLEKMN